MRDEFTKDQSWSIEIKRPGGMVLHPLAEVGIRVLMPICVGGSQLVMDILSHSEWGKPKKDAGYTQHHSGTEQGKKAVGSYW